jgi:SAM-dependent methyltransferase
MADRDSEYWQTAAEDREMQDEHAFVWQAMFDSIDTDLTGTRVLDIGCNQGGFLRLAVDTQGIAQGYGYDPASGAVADARRLAGERPLQFEVADDVPTGWPAFDVAFSHEVLYLIGSIGAHAEAVFRALVPGGVYYAVMGMHSASPIMVDWHREHADQLELPPIYDLDQVVTSFAGAGFDVAASPLKVGFIPMVDAPPRVMAWLHYYDETKVLLRFTRPGEIPIPSGSADLQSAGRQDPRLT